jgi:hypothetical protein
MLRRQDDLTIIGFESDFPVSVGVALSFMLNYIATFGFGKCRALLSKVILVRVVDAETGRGVLLVELCAMNQKTWYTDGNGAVAISGCDRDFLWPVLRNVSFTGFRDTSQLA